MSPHSTGHNKVNSWITRMTLVVMMVALSAVTCFAGETDEYAESPDVQAVVETEAVADDAEALPEGEAEVILDEEAPADVPEDGTQAVTEEKPAAEPEVVVTEEPAAEPEVVVTEEPAAVIEEEAAPAAAPAAEPEAVTVAAPTTVKAAEDTTVTTTAGAAAPVTTVTAKAVTYKSQWITTAGKTYYYNKYGKKLSKGFHYLNGKKYYFNADGSVKKGLFKLNGKTYYGKKTDNGRIIRNKVITLGKNKYVMGKSGAARVGYIKISKKVRYITNSAGKVIRSKWITRNGKKYYAGKNGKLVIGGLKKIAGKTYYFKADGSVVRDAVKVIDGYSYRFGKSGKLARKTVDGETLVDYALQFVGNPYRAGGSSLTHGTDCSGFTMSIYAHYGIDLDHYSYAQMHSGRAVSSPKPGDLVLYYGGGHVALYIGNGKVVHAMTSQYGIQVTDMYICGTPTCFRRILN